MNEEKQLREFVANMARYVYVDAEKHAPASTPPECAVGFVEMWARVPLDLIGAVKMQAELFGEPFYKRLEMFMWFSLKGYMVGLEVGAKWGAAS